MPQAKVIWTHDKQFVGESGSGHAIVLDSSKEVGGQNTGATPMELVLMALGSCTGIDVLFILTDKMKKTLTRLQIELEGNRAEEPPKVYKSINMVYRLAGPNLELKDALRAIQLSVDKYCSVAAMLQQSVVIHSHYEITNETTGECLQGEV